MCYVIPNTAMQRFPVSEITFPISIFYVLINYCKLLILSCILYPLTVTLPEFRQVACCGVTWIKVGTICFTRFYTVYNYDKSSNRQSSIQF